MGHIIFQDPTSLSARYSNDDKIQPSEAPEHPDYTECEYSCIKSYMDKIPPREADLLTLYYKYGMKQDQIAKLFGVTQAAVSYRLNKGKRRIQFLRTIPHISLSEFKSDLKTSFTDQESTLLWNIYSITCQSKVAKMMGLTQGRVRHKFFRAMATLKKVFLENIESIRKTDPSASDTASVYHKYIKALGLISDKKFNIMSEVSLPQFANRGDTTIITMDKV